MPANKHDAINVFFTIPGDSLALKENQAVSDLLLFYYVVHLLNWDTNSRSCHGRDAFPSHGQVRELKWQQRLRQQVYTFGFDHFGARSYFEPQQDLGCPCKLCYRMQCHMHNRHWR